MATSLGAMDLLLPAVKIVASGLYITAAALILRRPVERVDLPAQMGVVLWWLGLAFLNVIGIPFELGFNIAEAGLVAVRFVGYLAYPIWFLAIGGLSYYLLYIHTGRRSLWAPLAAYYTSLVLVGIISFETSGPYIGTDASGEPAVMTRTETPTWVGIFLGVGLIVPPLAAAGALVLLLLRVHDRIRRYRIAMIASGIVLWFGYSLVGLVVGAASGSDEGVLGEVVNALLGLLAALLVIMAYAPPRIIARRLGPARSVAA